MPIIHDKEFGDISIRRSRLASKLKLSVAPNGTLRVSMPSFAPLFLAKRLVSSSRSSIRVALNFNEINQYSNGQQIGKSHSVEIITGRPFSVKRVGQRIIIHTPNTDELSNSLAQKAIREVISLALRREASSYLSKRLAYLAHEHKFMYNKVRFSHASSRWGSCSSSGTISLNIALMRLPFELIDYVLIHELCHTKEMNHSSNFWHLVEAIDPVYKTHRKRLKSESPTI